MGLAQNNNTPPHPQNNTTRAVAHPSTKRQSTLHTRSRQAQRQDLEEWSQQGGASCVSTHEEGGLEEDASGLLGVVWCGVVWLCVRGGE